MSTSFTVKNAGKNASKRKECGCSFCDQAIRVKTKYLEGHIVHHCKTVTSEIKNQVSQHIGDRAPAVSTPAAKRQKDDSQHTQSAVKMTTVSKTTKPYAAELDRKFVRTTLLTTLSA
ncbi:TPA: hypothetical protein ACH3X1_004946 [Trebouxia sp. C0004]